MRKENREAGWVHFRYCIPTIERPDVNLSRLAA